MPKVSEFCEPKLRSAVEALGYELIEIEFVKKNNGMNLTLFIDSAKGVTLEDCERVHRAADAILEELNPTNDAPYVFNVSSPGLDRPYKSDKDFERNINKTVDITLYKKQGNNKKFTGILTFVNKNEIGLTIEGESVVFKRADIAHAVMNIKV